MNYGFVRGFVSMYDIVAGLRHARSKCVSGLKSNMSGPIAVQIRMKYNNLILAGHQQPSKALRFLMWSPT